MNTLRISAFFTDSTAQPDDTHARLMINIATFLSVLCWVFIAAFVISLVVPSLRKRFIGLVEAYVPFLLWFVPATAMFFSLYYSEVLGWTPCRLCWYQRVCMYSLALLMLIYWFKKSRFIKIAAWVLALIGPAISIYHIGVERLWFTESTSCDPNVPCSQVWFYSLDFLTIAGMALTAFATILVLLYLDGRNSTSSALSDHEA